MLPPRLVKQKRREQAIRSPAHRAFVRSHSCSVSGCDRLPIECAHVRLGSHAGVGQKPDDSHCISLCGGVEGHHAESHRVGEATFAAKYSLDLQAIASAFWQASPHRRKFVA